MTEESAHPNGRTVLVRPSSMEGAVAAKRILERSLGGGWGELSAHGPDGWKVYNARMQMGVIVSCATHDGQEWLHASMAHRWRDPDYSEVATLKAAVFGPARFAYMVFPTIERHVNLHEHALHLWGREDGANVLPDFGLYGTV